MLAIEGRQRMGKGQLETWLVGKRGARNPERFVLAVLRDMYPDDRDVSRWLHEARPELGGKCASDLLATSRAVEIEALVVRDWNER